MATLNSTYGKPSVDIPGFGRIGVEVAARLGYIERNPITGMWKDSAQCTPAAEVAAHQAPLDATNTDAADNAAAVDAEEANAWQDWAEPQHSFDAATASTSGVIAGGGDDFKSTILALAQSGGCGPSRHMRWCPRARRITSVSWPVPSPRWA